MPAMPANEVTAYLESSGLEKELADCVNQVVREKAPDALARLSELLAAKGGKPVTPPLCDYLDTVGNTPLVKLGKCLPEGVKAARVLAKLEMCNPGGSLKDRIALQMIEKAEKDGLITPGKTTLVDFTSGNTGIGEAMVCAAKGYKCIIVMPQVPPMFERYIICRQFGAEVRLLNPAAGGVAWVNYTKELASQPDHWYIGQMENESNPAAHIENTGPEIWAQSAGQVDYFVHGIGTGGCIAGVGKFLKDKNPACKVVALEPSEARIHTGAPMGKHGIVGWAPGFHSNFLDGVGKPAAELSDAPRGVVDEWGHVSTAECVEWATKVTQTEGMMVGPSAGAAIKYACDVACRPEAAGKTIVVVVPSHGIRYVQHPLWGKMKAEVATALPSPPCSDKEAPILQWDSAAQP
jgi:cysteine synthase A